MLRSYPRQNFGSTSPMFSQYTSCKEVCVFGEQWGGAAEILARIGAEHGNWPHLRIRGLSKKRGQSETDTVRYTQWSACLQPYLFRTGDA